MSAPFWVGFFRDAGIPYSLAKSYAATFEENRIGKDMLLDLDKGILADMGIKVMGDVIGILKHARKEARKDSASVTVSGSTTKHKSSSTAVHSTQSAPQAPAVSTTSSPLLEHRDETFIEETGMMEYREREPGHHLPLDEHLQTEPEYRTMHSDIIQQVVAAVTQQQQQQQQQPTQQDHEEEEEGTDEVVVDGGGGGGVGGDLVSPTMLDMQDEFQEEYVTEAYKRKQQKRALGSLYSDSVDSVLKEPPQTKQPRFVILPQENPGKMDGASEVLATPPVAMETSSRRILEAAGLVKRGEQHGRIPPPPDKATVSSSVSVFSRLDGKGRISSVDATTHPPSSSSSSSAAVVIKSTSPPQPPRKRTVISATSPSPKKLGLRVTSRHGRRISTTSGRGTESTRRIEGRGGGGGGGGGEETVVVRRAKRETPGSGGLVSSSSSFTVKEPIKNRLGARANVGGGGGGGGERYDSGINWSEAVSTSSRSSSHIISRRPRLTMVADSATHPLPKASLRLGGTGHKMVSPPASPATVSSGSRTSVTQWGDPPNTLLSTMKADEYEMQRQLDIRSRLAAREKEVEERRSGPLRGRLGQHRVFERLT